MTAFHVADLAGGYVCGFEALEEHPQLATRSDLPTIVEPARRWPPARLV